MLQVYVPNVVSVSDVCCISSVSCCKCLMLFRESWGAVSNGLMDGAQSAPGPCGRGVPGVSGWGRAKRQGHVDGACSSFILALGSRPRGERGGVRGRSGGHNDGGGVRVQCEVNRGQAMLASVWTSEHV
jgi:hypothetical protein